MSVHQVNHISLETQFCISETQVFNDAIHISFRVNVLWRDMNSFVLPAPNYGLIVGRLNSLALVRVKSKRKKTLKSNQDVIEVRFVSRDNPLKKLTLCHIVPVVGGGLNIYTYISEPNEIDQ